MAKLRFDFDWVEAERVQGPDLSATWASLKIIAGDSAVTHLLDYKAKSVRDFVYVPLYPLAEWLAENWWFLAYEYQSPEKEGSLDFHRRHSLDAGREGYALPHLHMIASGATTQISWNGSAPQWTNVEFLDRGQLTLETSEFRDACADLIDSVVRRLVSFGIEDTSLQQEWAAIQATERDSEELAFCEIAAGLGWDPYDMDRKRNNAVIKLAKQLGDLVHEAVHVVNADALGPQSLAIVKAIENTRKRAPLLRSLKDLPVDWNRDAPNAPPWDEGYHCARKLRQQLSLDGEPLSTMEALASALGEDRRLMDEATQPDGSLGRTPQVDGVIAIHEDMSASFAFQPRSELGRRFSLCRAIGEVLTSGGSRALLTKSHSERQQRNRAFAAEFLAPSHSLRTRVTRALVDEEEVADLAEEFGVSWYVIKHQIENHQIARLATPGTG